PPGRRGVAIMSSPFTFAGSTGADTGRLLQAGVSRRALPFLAVWCALVVACTSANPAPSSGGGTLIDAMSAGDNPSMDTPPDQGFEGYRFVGYQLYDPLVRFDV